jgi:hypothetical protein
MSSNGSRSVADMTSVCKGQALVPARPITVTDVQVSPMEPMRCEIVLDRDPSPQEVVQIAVDTFNASVGLMNTHETRERISSAITCAIRSAFPCFVYDEAFFVKVQELMILSRALEGRDGDFSTFYSCFIQALETYYRRTHDR